MGILFDSIVGYAAAGGGQELEALHRSMLVSHGERGKYGGEAIRFEDGGAGDAIAAGRSDAQETAATVVVRTPQFDEAERLEFLERRGKRGFGSAEVTGEAGRFDAVKTGDVSE